MSRPDPRPLPTTPGLRVSWPIFDEHEAVVEDEEYDGNSLWRLFGAATVAVLALAMASLVLV